MCFLNLYLPGCSPNKHHFISNRFLFLKFWLTVPSFMLFCFLLVSFYLVSRHYSFLALLLAMNSLSLPQMRMCFFHLYVWRVFLLYLAIGVTGLFFQHLIKVMSFLYSSYGFWWEIHNHSDCSFPFIFFWCFQAFFPFFVSSSLIVICLGVDLFGFMLL